MYIEYLKLATQYKSLTPLWLGGAGGPGGGSGGPPGGFVGQLPQTKVTYDTSEASASSGSDSLLDNLNHIRYTIANLKFTAGVSGVEFNQVEYSGGNIDLTISTDSGWTDVDAANAAITITPQNIGAFKVSCTFQHGVVFASDATENIEVWFRLTDGATSIAPVISKSDIFSVAGTSTLGRSGVINLTGLFTWLDTSPKTIKLQRWNKSFGTVASSAILTASPAPVLHMDVFRLGGGTSSGYVSGAGVAGQVAYWTSGSILGGDSSFTMSGGQLNVNKLVVTAGSIGMGGFRLTLDNSMELDPTGVAAGQLLGYNGVKWVPQSSSGSLATTGSGGLGQFALWAGTSALNGDSRLAFASVTGKINLGGSSDTIGVGINGVPPDNVTLQVAQPSGAGGTNPKALAVVPGTLTAQTGDIKAVSVSSLTATWIKAFLPTAIALNSLAGSTLNSDASGGVIGTASTLEIVGPPTSGSNLTITNPYALRVTSGTTSLEGGLLLQSNRFTLDAAMEIDPSSALDGQVLTYSAGIGRWVARNSSGSGSGGGGGSSGLGGSGAAARIAYWTSGSILSGDAQFNWDSANQRMVIGGATTDVPTGFQNRIIVIGDNTLAGMTAISYGSIVPSVSLNFASGTKALPSAVTNGQGLGRINASGYGASGWADSTRTRIQAAATENWDDAKQGSQWSLYVTRTGTTTLVEALDVKYDRISIVGKDLVLDANIELDPTGATLNQALIFNGSKFTAQTISSVSGISGSGVSGQIAYFTSGSVLGSSAYLAWNTSGSSLDIKGLGLENLYGYSNAGDPGATIAGASESYPRLTGLRARGSLGSEFPLLSGDLMLTMAAYGWYGGGYSPAPSAAIDFEAAENWTSGSYGSAIRFWVTRPGTAQNLSNLKLSWNKWTMGVSSPGLPVINQTSNNDASNPLSSAAYLVNTTGSNAGDPYMNWRIGAVDWIMGLDNSDQPNNPKLKIDKATTVGGNTLWSLDSTGLMSVGAASQVWNGKTIKFDNTIEVDPSGATNGQVLSYNSGASKWVPATASSGSGSGSNLGWFNVKDYGAVGDGSTNDTTSITSAIAALNTAGRGVLYFPAGNYKTSGGFSITADALVMGDGPGNVYATGYASQVQCTSGSAVLFTMTALRSRIANLALKNTSGSTPTAGAGVKVSGSDTAQCVDLESCLVYGFYDNVVQNGAQWSIRNSFIAGNVRYGIYVHNTINPDSGDWMISDCVLSSDLYDSTAGIRIESSGGGKIINCKTYDGWVVAGKRFTNVVDLQPTGNSVILLIDNCSFEYYASNGVNVAVGSHTWSAITVRGCEFGCYFAANHAVQMSATTLGNLKGVIITDNLFRGTVGTVTGAAVDITKVDQAIILNNINTDSGFAGGLLTQSGCTNISSSFGTVTSVDLSMPAEFTVSGNPITSSGTLTVSKANESQNLIYASPNGLTGAPTFRAIVAADVGTGTADSTKVLGGDMAWHTPTSAGAGQVLGIDRLSGDGSTTVFSLADTAEFIVSVVDNGLDVDPFNYTLSTDGTQVTFSTAPTAGHWLLFTYVIGQI